MRLPVECPTPHLIALFLGGGVSEQERERVERHIDDCDDCRKLIASIVRSESAVPDPPTSADSADSEDN